jgi:hypothetical protein
MIALLILLVFPMGKYSLEILVVIEPRSNGVWCYGMKPMFGSFLEGEGKETHP